MTVRCPLRTVFGQRRIGMGGDLGSHRLLLIRWDLAGAARRDARLQRLPVLLFALPAPQAVYTAAGRSRNLNQFQTRRLGLEQSLTEIAGISAWHDATVPESQLYCKPL